MDKEEKLVVFPSEIHKFAYCPRQYFFSLYIPMKPPLLRRLRMLLGTLYHMIKGWVSARKGYRVEERVEKDLGRIRLRGRPDSYRREDGRLEIIERKSGAGPRKGVWMSDMLQVTAYGLMLHSGEDEVILKVEYRSARRISRLDSDKIALLTRIIDDIVLVKKYGIVPYANKSPKRCAKCPYRALCEELDRALPAEELYEPGRIVAEKRIDTSFIEES